MSGKKKQLAFGVVESYCKYELHYARYVAMAEVIRNELLGKSNIKLLDVGCGTGNLAKFCKFKSIDWFGLNLDIDWSDLNGVKRLVDRYSLVLNDATQGIAFRDKCFDIVVCSHMLEHTLCPEKIIKEIHRVLKNGGLLIIGIPIFTTITKRLRINIVPLYDKLTKHAPRGHIYFFTIDDIKKMLCDFNIVDIRGFRFFSARKILPLENSCLFYKISTALGRRFPNLTAEINCVARKKSET